MPSLEDLRADAIGELAADRCDALHSDYADPDCSECDAKYDQRRQDAADERTACTAILAGGRACGEGESELWWHVNPDDSRAIDHEYQAPAGAH